jgi:hypothetical protein
VYLEEQNPVKHLHKRDKDISIACYSVHDANLILSTLAGSAWIGIRLADISSQNVSCEAQEARLRPVLSCGMSRHLMLLVVCEALGSLDQTMFTRRSRRVDYLVLFR